MDHRRALPASAESLQACALRGQRSRLSWISFAPVFFVECFLVDMFEPIREVVSTIRVSGWDRELLTVDS